MAETLNESQKQYIVGYIKRVRDVSGVICVGLRSRKCFIRECAQIAKKLNSLGPPVKTTVQWHKVLMHLLKIAMLKASIRNRRLPSRKFNLFIPKNKTSLVKRLNGISTVKKIKFSLDKVSERTNCCLPARRKARGRISGIVSLPFRKRIILS